MAGIIDKSKKFVLDTIAELNKSSWPPRNELIESTLLVIVSVILLGSFVACVDAVSREILTFLTTK